MNINVFLREQKVPDAVSPEAAAAMAALKDRLEKAVAEFTRRPVNDERWRIWREIDVAAEMTISIIASGIVGQVESLKRKMERMEDVASFADRGSAIILSHHLHRPDVSAYLWARQTESGVVLNLHFSADRKQIGEEEPVHTAADFDAAYDWMLEHRERLAADLKTAVDALAKEALAAAEVMQAATATEA